MRTDTRQGLVQCTRGGSSRFLSRSTNILLLWRDMSSATSVDDLASVNLWMVRGIEIRGRAEVLMTGKELGAGPRCGGVSHPPEADCQLGHQFAGLHTTERPLGCVTAAGERLPACVQKSLAPRGATACSGSRKSFRSFCRRSQAKTEDGGGGKHYRGKA